MPEPEECDKTKPRGLRPTDLVIVLCDLDVCLNSIVLSLAAKIGLDQGLSVGVFSHEMDREAVAWNLLAARSGVNFERLRRGLLGREEWPLLSRAAGRIAEASIIVENSERLSLQELQEQVVRLKEESDLALVIVDIRQILHGCEECTSHILSSLKRMAEKVSRPFVVFSPLRHLSERCAGFRQSDAVVFVSRDETQRDDRGRCCSTAEARTLKHNARMDSNFTVPVGLRWHPIAGAATEECAPKSASLLEELKRCFKQIERGYQGMGIDRE